MCKYRYHYYATCRHQQTVLFDFCERAPLLATTPAREAPAKPPYLDKREGEHQPAPRSPLPRSKTKRKKKKQQQPRMSSSLHSNPSSFLQTTSSPTSGSAIVTEEPLLDPYSSLPVIAPYFHHPSNASEDMALPPFSTTFRDWMSGGASKPVEAPPSMRREFSNNINKDSISAAAHSRRKHPGIRENTDESCDLPKSSDLLQHLAESCRGKPEHVLHMQQDDTASVCSTVEDASIIDEIEHAEDPLDAIAAELEEMRREVARLKRESDMMRASPEQEVESAASRLQRAHEALKHRTSGVLRQQSQPTPPNAFDFPALGNESSAPSATAQDIASGQKQTAKKPSYAKAATTGMKDAIDQAFASTRPKKRAECKSSDAASDGPVSATSAHSGSSVLQGSSEMSASLTSQSTADFRGSTDGDQDSVIVSPRSVTSGGAAVGKSDMGNAAIMTPEGQHMKSPPRFAQPTKAFAKRAGETLRKNPTSPDSKVVLHGSPTKTFDTKGLRLDTGKRVTTSQQKRKSLPGGWVNASCEGADVKEDTALSRATTASLSSPVSATTVASSDEDWQMISSIGTSRVPVEQKLRKKTSSYMAPTTATMRRTVATVGHEGSKLAMTPVKKSVQSSPKVDQSGTTPATSSPFLNEVIDQPVRCSSDGPVDALQSPRSRLEQNHADESNKQHVNAIQRGPLSRKTRSTAATVVATPLSKIPRVCKTSPAVARKTDIGAPSLGELNPPRPELPEVANTTAMRVTSHADMLQSILSKLDSQGLLRSHAENSSISPQITTCGDHGKPFRHKKPLMDDATRRALQDIRFMKAVPPYLKKQSRESSAASTDSEATLIAVDSPAPQILPTLHSQTGHLPHQSTMAREQKDSNVDCETPCPLPHKSRGSSLRANAQEFTPLWKPQTMEHELRLLSWQGVLDPKSESESSTMPEDVKKSIQTLRDFKRTGSQAPSLPLDPYSQHSPSSSPSKPGDRLVGDLVMPEASGQPISSNVVHAGQVLKPSLSPGKQTMQWTMRDIDGSEKPLSFGRAPPPPAPIFTQPETPVISPTSDDTSPNQTPRNEYSWTIGSTGAPWHYGWKGGDGKEIRFNGYGPQAERDPNVPVTMGFYSRGSSASNSPSKGPFATGAAGENSSPRPVVWPRSQRQWARLAAQSRAPCGNMEITHAVEQMPFAQPMAGYCNDCR